MSRTMTVLTSPSISVASCRVALAVFLSAAIAAPIPALAATGVARLEGGKAVVDVNVALGESDDAIIAERITAKATDALRAKDITILEGTAPTRVHVSVRWNADDNHEITLQVTNKGEATQKVEGSPFVCKACSENELLAKITEVVPGAAPLVAVPEDGVGDPVVDPAVQDPAVQDPVVQDDPGPTEPPRERVGLAPLAGVGIGVAAIGVAGMIAGGVLLAKPDEIDPAAGGAIAIDEKTYRPPGIGFLAGGGAMVAIGVALIVVGQIRHKRKHDGAKVTLPARRSLTWSPTVVRRGVAMGLSGRF